PVAATRRPSSTVSRAGSETRPMLAIEPSTTRVPSPATGEMKPSPAGRLPNVPGALMAPASGIPGRPPRARRVTAPSADENVLALADREAVVDHRADGAGEIGRGSRHGCPAI